MNYWLKITDAFDRRIVMFRNTMRSKSYVQKLKIEIQTLKFKMWYETWININLIRKRCKRNVRHMLRNLIDENKS